MNGEIVIRNVRHIYIKSCNTWIGFVCCGLVCRVPVSVTEGQGSTVVFV